MHAIAPCEEIFGECPSSILRGSPPLNSIAQTACVAPAGLLVGFGDCPAEFFSPPRVYTTVSPSSEKLTWLSSCPSSCKYEVSRRASHFGASATQMLRLPLSSSVQAIRFAFFAATRSAANGAERSCSSVTGLAG